MAQAEHLTRIINHVFLPPKLPQTDDSAAFDDAVLIGEFAKAWDLFRPHLPVSESSKGLACSKMLKQMIELRDPSGCLRPADMNKALASMNQQDVLTVHVRSQNAGLIVRRSEKQFIFEMFELSPTSEAAMSAKGRLRRCFPGPAIALDQTRIQDPHFREAFVQLLTSLDKNTPVESMPKAVKARSLTTEVRDTIHPKFVTEMMSGILRGIGQPHDATRIWKATRDDVCWDNTLKPWRRSPLWLLLRVALQSSLLASDAMAQTWFKPFMVFFMSRILQQAVDCSLPSDILFIMAAKISRRTLKLSLEEGPSYMNAVHQSIDAAHQVLAGRWSIIEMNPDPFSTQKKFDAIAISASKHTFLSLHKLGPYLKTVDARKTPSNEHCTFNPICTQRIEQQASSFPSLNKSGSAADLTLCLADVELWIEDCLAIWLKANLHSGESCSLLTRLIDDYTSLAVKMYAGNPEAISLMLLNAMDLWVALDKCALRQCSFLDQYDPNFPPSLFDPLLLPKHLQMKRLSKVEQYLQQRRDLSSKTVLRGKTFAIQFYDQSPHHQSLRAKIELAARQEREARKSELATKKQSFIDLTKSYEALSCQTVPRRRRRQQVDVHVEPCRRCQLRVQATNLRIWVHEWPLPLGEDAIKSAVFELDVPVPIAKWRDATYTLLVDIFSLGQQKSSGTKPYFMKEFSGLDEYYISSKSARVQCASTTKPFAISHYSWKFVCELLTEQDICVNHGSTYDCYDQILWKPTKDLLDNCDIRKKCTLHLPPGAFSKLQFTLSGTTHTSNEIIAMQVDCPTLNLHELYSFGSLRAGHHLQWRNIARELVSHVLNFSCEETYLLLLQAAWQAGKSGIGEICRESHTDLEEVEFAESLLQSIIEAIKWIEGNWQAATALRTFIVLTTRVLSLNQSKEVQSRCIIVLKRARDVAIRWTRQVCGLLHETEDPAELKMLNMRVLELASSSHSTYDVERNHMPEVLSSAEDMAQLIKCAITIHDHCPVVAKNLPHHIQSLLYRFGRLSHLLEKIVQEKISSDRKGIDCAISQTWSGYRPGASWIAMKGLSSRWVTSTTAKDKDCAEMSVQYNILDGSLLVNGKPLARLPQSYEIHPTYRRLFGEKVLDVVPSIMKGMDFEMRSELHGQQVSFSMVGKDLIVRTLRDGRIYEYLPTDSLVGDFPKAFVQDYAHWLRVDTKSVELRPLTHAWTPSTENWHMQLNRSISTLSRGGESLIDIRSHAAQKIARVLSPLEHAEYIHIISHGSTGHVHVHLPRYKLNFSIKKHGSTLDSKEFRGMIVDTVQSFGSLTGLENKLVLRDIEGHSRVVLVPHGEVSFQRDSHHVRVMISTGTALNIKYYSYVIDNQLGRLVDDGSLQSKLFRLYLHATTSHCLADSLTLKTGTETAIDGLESAGTRSFVSLGPSEIQVLTMLANLTPQRGYYPDHLRVMQTVKWAELSPLSQHCAYHKLVKSILEQARSLHIFQESPTQLPLLNTGYGENLQARAAIRDSSFQVDGYGAEEYTISHDVVYRSRDQTHQTGSGRERQTCHTAKLVDNWSQNLSVHPRLLSKIEAWRTSIQGLGNTNDFTLGFELQWLERLETIFPSNLCAMHHTLSNTTERLDKYKVMLFLSTLAYSEHADQELIQTLLAFTTIPQLRALDLPKFEVFQLSKGYTPIPHQLTDTTKNYARGFNECPESRLPSMPDENREMADERHEDQHETARDHQIETFVGQLVSQWPTGDIAVPTDAAHNTYINVAATMQSVRPVFASWFHNRLFKLRLEKIQVVLDKISCDGKTVGKYSFSLPVDKRIARRTCVTFDDLAQNQACSLPPRPREDFATWASSKKDDLDHGITKLDDLLVRIGASSSSRHEQEYIEDLTKSHGALLTRTAKFLNEPSDFIDLLSQYLYESKCHEETSYQMIRDQLENGNWTASRKALMLPRSSRISILSHLASDKMKALPIHWRRIFVEYGVSVTALQQAERLVASSKNAADMFSELLNTGHTNWDPLEYPEWLLLELENDILIRHEQAEIAREMISPSSGSNSVMQLNMGLGKTSVIVPITAVKLADRTQLVRIIVLKALSMQMFELLRNKLGGLLNRRIFYMPFSRSMHVDESTSSQIRSLLEECLRVGGVILIQPEHLLSFELMGYEKLLTDDVQLGMSLTKTQDWLRSNSRDLLDESDEILSVRFELIYSMGGQRPSDFGPDRWTITQEVLRILIKCTPVVQASSPNGLEVSSAEPGTFPRIRILEASVGKQLIAAIAERVCQDGLRGVPVWRLDPNSRQLLFKFLTDPALNPTILIEQLSAGSATIRQALWLLRGLFAYGVLKFCLEQKRWRVQYGLDLSRSMLAIPYHAKDSPSPRAEFSHPDATIILTCLSYYYGGLSDEQLRSCFEALLQSDHASEEYGYWVRDAPNLPEAFRQLSGINLKNVGQCIRDVFPSLRFAVGVVNFYMSTLVFPIEMKEFPQKLSSSGWDIASLKEHPTTGFSGTNDSRYILPTSISQCDLPQTLSTNAAVLECLLRPENIVEDIRRTSSSEIFNAEALINMASLLDPPARVILDVGALLELQNEDMASLWLTSVPDTVAQAIIFFDAKNDLCVMSRDGSKELQQVSPFLKQMDQCLVYLDEAHTRGTDMRMPSNYRAIVTLGPGLTKDRLAQACMRMRKLGKGQSVVFCPSLEVYRKIAEHNQKDCSAIEVADVLQWCIANTCSFARKNMPLWATQGLRHQRRIVARSQPLLAKDGKFSDHLSRYLLEKESQTLEERYGLSQFEDSMSLLPEQPLPGQEQQLAIIKAKCAEFEVSSFNTAALYEEQERELSPENEREQEVERPAKASPCKHALHVDVRLLVEGGILKRSSDAFGPAFGTFCSTSAGKYFESTWPKDLLVTRDFAQTVGNLSGAVVDDYMRPVHWVISSKNGDRLRLVIISPFEAQELLPSIRKYKKVTLHVYTPRLNISARTLEDLSFCAIPAVPKSWSIPPLARDLNIFAGQLYIRDYDEYAALCSFLGLCSQAPDSNMEVAADGFITVKRRVLPSSATNQLSPFQKSPVAFVKMIMSLRRKGQSFTMSHLGMLLNGDLIPKEQFER